MSKENLTKILFFLSQIGKKKKPKKKFWKILCVNQGRWNETHFGRSILQIAAARYPPGLIGNARVRRWADTIRPFAIQVGARTGMHTHLTVSARRVNVVAARVIDRFQTYRS